MKNLVSTIKYDFIIAIGIFLVWKFFTVFTVKAEHIIIHLFGMYIPFSIIWIGLGFYFEKRKIMQLLSPFLWSFIVAVCFVGNIVSITWRYHDWLKQFFIA